MNALDIKRLGEIRDDIERVHAALGAVRNEIATASRLGESIARGVMQAERTLGEQHANLVAEFDRLTGVR